MKDKKDMTICPTCRGVHKVKGYTMRDRKRCPKCDHDLKAGLLYDDVAVSAMGMGLVNE